MCIRDRDILLREGKRRAFSIANAPHEDAFLELHVRHMPGGQFTGQVFSTMQAVSYTHLDVYKRQRQGL